MIAIPLEKRDSTLISTKYENAPYFAILDTITGYFKVTKNEACGNEIETAKYLKDLGIDDTIFYKMSKKAYDYFYENGVRVYTSTKIKLTIDEIYRNYRDEKCKLLTKSNSENFLN